MNAGVFFRIQQEVRIQYCEISFKIDFSVDKYLLYMANPPRNFPIIE